MRSERVPRNKRLAQQAQRSTCVLLTAVAVRADLVCTHLSRTAEPLAVDEKVLATCSDMHRDPRALAALHCSRTSPRDVSSAAVIASSPLQCTQTTSRGWSWKRGGMCYPTYSADSLF